MNKTWTCWLMFLIIGSTYSEYAVAAEAGRPNIVFMLSDDQHWDEHGVPMLPGVSFSHRDHLHTPRLSQLAAQGMRFSAAYAPGPVCSPTRVSLQTGRTPAALRWTKAGPSLRSSANPMLLPPQSVRSIDHDEVTFAELLQEAGYTTAHFGKWHLQAGGPEAHGYDVSDGNIGNEASSKYAAPNPVDLFGMAERAEALIAQAHADGEPFFIQLSWLALHSPENALPETVEKYTQTGTRRSRSAQRAALTENLDTAIGRVLDAIDRLGLADNTYVVFMSDNGGNGRDGLNGGKGNLYEGGIRVPLIVRGPAIESDAWCHTPVVGYDLYPTFLDWAGIETPPDVKPTLDGGSLTGLLTKRSDQVDRANDALFFHFPHYQTRVGPHSAIRLGKHKLLKFYETGDVELYDLSNDLRERNNLAATLPDTAADLERLLDAYLASVDAAMPTRNAGYDPDKPTQMTNDRERGGSSDRDNERRRERRR